MKLPRGKTGIRHWLDTGWKGIFKKGIPKGWNIMPQGYSTTLLLSRWLRAAC